VAVIKPPIPVGSAKVAVSGFVQASTWTNVYYFDIGDVGSHTPGEVISTLAETVHELYNTALKTYLSNLWSVAYSTISYRDATDSLIRLRVADAIVGSQDPGPEAAQVAMLIDWATGDPRRGGKPRQYIAGLAETALVDDARLTSTVIHDYNVALLAWLESLPTPAGGRLVPLQLVEMSFRNAKTWRDNAHSYPIIGVSINPVVATQRRRVNRLRPH
jgi:hypothetical protein